MAHLDDDDDVSSRRASRGGTPGTRRRVVNDPIAPAAATDVASQQGSEGPTPTPTREAAAVDSGAPSQPRPAARRDDDLEALASQVVSPRPRRDTPLQGSAPVAPRDDRDAERSRSRGDERRPQWDNRSRPRDERPAREEPTWYVLAGTNGREGPFTFGNLRAGVSEGRLTRTSQVWREGQDGWQPVSAFPELLKLIPPPAPQQPQTAQPPPLPPSAPAAPLAPAQSFCDNCGTDFVPGAKFCDNCGNPHPTP